MFRVSLACITVFTTLQICTTHPADMSKKTVLNEQYQGLLETMSIPAEIHEQDGRKYASFGSAVPIHTCSKEQVSEHAAGTHHYCDIFTRDTLAPLAELAFVRLDDRTAEKVFINRNKRMLVTSSDGVLAQWRAAPTFESGNRFVAGTPLVRADGRLLSLVTARRGNHYAVSNIDGPGGYFETTASWHVVSVPEGHLVYGNRTFPSRECLREYIASLPPGAASPPGEPIRFSPSVAVGGQSVRITLVADSGRQIVHHILDDVIAKDVEYL